VIIKIFHSQEFSPRHSSVRIRALLHFIAFFHIFFSYFSVAGERATSIKEDIFWKKIKYSRHMLALLLCVERDEKFSEISCFCIIFEISEI
jgi:hypothetical protein